MLRRAVVSLVILSGFFSVLTVVSPTPVAAQTGANTQACGRSANNFLGFPTWYKYLNPGVRDPDGGGPQPASCTIDFDFPADIGKVLLALVEVLLRVAGLVAVGFVIWGGFKYILSQGNPENAKNARSTIVNALIGLAIAASATVIVNLVAGNLIT